MQNNSKITQISIRVRTPTSLALLLLGHRILRSLLAIVDNILDVGLLRLSVILFGGLRGNLTGFFGRFIGLRLRCSLDDVRPR